MYLKELFISTYEYLIKLFTNEFFYLGGLIGGIFFYLTGLTVGQLQSIMIIVVLDIATRCWAEAKNRRPIMSRRMFGGFAGKFASYMILFTLAEHSFVFKDTFSYIILGGFSLVEFRSIYENMREAGQKHLTFIGDKIQKEIEKF